MSQRRLQSWIDTADTPASRYVARRIAELEEKLETARSDDGTVEIYNELDRLIDKLNEINTNVRAERQRR